VTKSKAAQPICFFRNRDGRWLRPTDLDDLHATATAIDAAIIRAKSAVCGCLISEDGSSAMTVRNDYGLA
jgi:hypothetical protein